ncbi:MAG: replication initiation protein [Paraburkholderia sp.]|uniref:replication initiation protein n=1 Tax=Paraburkholderia sp. TaxID=1926495 RepID=UPI003C601875
MADRFPARPYCADDYGDGIYFRPRADALDCRHIQINGPAMLGFLAFDVDKRGGADFPEDRGLPPPTWACTNPANGHAHLAYALRAPVCKTLSARQDPLRYAAAVEEGMRLALSADAAYAGLMIKNPYCGYWITEKNPVEYDLGELAEYLPDRLPGSARRMEQRAAELAARVLHRARQKDRRERCETGDTPLAGTFGLGRNVMLFDELRKYAYRAIRKYWHDGFDSWFSHLEDRAQELNMRFPAPLVYAEVRNTAKSVAKWAWKYFSQQAFNNRQKAVACKRGERTRQKVLAAVDRIDSPRIADIAAACCLSKRQVQRIASQPRDQYLAGSVEQQLPWEQEGISRRTWYRRQKEATVSLS